MYQIWLQQFRGVNSKPELSPGLQDGSDLGDMQTQKDPIIGYSLVPNTKSFKDLNLFEKIENLKILEKKGLTSFQHRLASFSPNQSLHVPIFEQISSSEHSGERASMEISIKDPDNIILTCLTCIVEILILWMQIHSL